MVILTEPMRTTQVHNRRIDWDRGTVSDGAGQHVTLRPQSLAVLKLLAAKRGQLVSKEEMMVTIWPSLAVTDDSLVHCITEIRRALEDNDHAIVKTISKRGYVLEPDAQEPAVRKRPFVVTVLAAALAIALLTASLMWTKLGYAQFYHPAPTACD